MPIDWGLAVAIGVPMTGGACFMIRYFVNKGKCLVLLKNKIENLEGVASSSGKTHDDIYNKIGDLETSVANIDGKLDVILSKNGWN